MFVGMMIGSPVRKPDAPLTVVGLVAEVPSLLRPQRLELRQREISCKESRTIELRVIPSMIWIDNEMKLLN